MENPVNMTFEQWKADLIQYRRELKIDNPEDVTDDHVQEWKRTNLHIHKLRKGA